MDERVRDAGAANGAIGIASPTDQQAGRPGNSRRNRRRHAMMRWLMAGVGVATLSRFNAQSADATNGDAVTAGNIVNATSPTGARNGVSYAADATADGLQGYAQSANNSGLFGRNNDSNGIGVSGAGPSGTGVFGESINGFGIGGRSTSNIAIYGVSTTGKGVRGESTDDIGVSGFSVNQIAVRGDSTNNYGVYGASSVNAVRGDASGSGVGVVGTGSTAGYFVGTVTVSGNFNVTGSKSAVVRHPDGSDRRLYCVEAPESWFEDYGGGQLTAGRGQVSLDPDFAALVKTDVYRVFLTPEGDCKGLYVTAKTPVSFEVRELQGGTSTIPFSYRILAKRKDIAGPRLERVDLRLPSAPGFQPPVPVPTVAAPPAATATPTIVPSSATATPTGTPTATPTVLPSRTATPGPTGSPPAS